MEGRIYGVPYKGGKSAIAAGIVGALPGGEVFVDMMAGGCAVTHAAMRSGRYGRFIANDLDWRGVTLFRDAVFGCYRDERRIVDRSYFEANKGSDAYVALCWSFGYNGVDYLWNKETEGAKLRACRMVMGETWQERAAAYRDFVKYLQDRRAELADRRARATERQKEAGEVPGRDFKNLENLERLERLQSLECLERLRGLAGLAGVSRLDVRVGDYRSVEVPEGSVVYCDPPYRGTDGYFGVEFDHEAFYGWLRACGYPVWVSEYSMPGDFVPVWRREKRVTLAAARNDLRSVETLWLHERWADKIAKTELF